MTDFQPSHPLNAFFEQSNPSNGEGVTVEIASAEKSIVQLFARKDKVGAVERALKIKQTPGKATFGADYTSVPITPGQWVLVSTNPAGIAFGKELTKKLKANGYVSEQSDSRVIFSLSGPRVRELLEKGCRLDLHPSLTGKGWCAQTQIAQSGVIMVQTDDEPRYDLMVYSGFAQHFAEWLHHTGLQLGIRFKR